MSTKIVVQKQDFSLQSEYAWLLSHQAGAVNIFSGLVREFAETQEEQFLELEHYPGMAESQLAAIVDQSQKRWSMQAVVLIHRYGKLMPGEQIVLVGVASKHRAEAFSACEFIMDYLKTDAPFWKKETRGTSSKWVQTHASDARRRQSWHKEK